MMNCFCRDPIYGIYRFIGSMSQSSAPELTLTASMPIRTGQSSSQIQRKLKIGYFSHYYDNTLDPLAWSGTVFSIQRQLQNEGFEVVHLGTAKHLTPFQRKFAKYFKKLLVALRLPQPSVRRQRHQFIKSVQRNLQQNPCDVVLAPVAAAEVAMLETDIPIIYLSDATAKVYYPLYRKGDRSVTFANTVEAEYRTYDRAKQIIFSSHWAAQSAIDTYGVNPSKVNVIPFGANLAQLPTRQQVLENRRSPLNQSSCKLMFCSVDWDRKGGAIAFATLLALLEMNIDAELIVIGCKPSEQSQLQHEKVRLVGFLDKGSAQDCQTLENILWESHFFLLPTRADCSPIVLCEASAYGLPSLTSQVGGVAEVVIDGKNGYALPLDASGQDYAEKVRHLIQNPSLYEALIHSSRDEYEQRLNWGHWGQRFRQVLEAALD
jgi:glycosyltransferase involved in cell wall biosynthesis